MWGIDAIYWILINSAVSFVYLFIISKILGKKQIAQLEFIDYAVGISLGSIAADWAVDAENPFYYYVIAMSIYFLFEFLVAVIGRKTTFFKRIFKGKPAMLIYEGKINYYQLNKCKIDINDLLSMLREKDYFDIRDVAYAIFEPSGELSVLPKGNQKPVVVEDLENAKIEQASITNVLVVDGVVSKSGLSEIEKDQNWLFNKLKIKQKSELKQILLAVYDDQTGEITTYQKEKVGD